MGEDIQTDSKQKSQDREVKKSFDNQRVDRGEARVKDFLKSYESIGLAEFERNDKIYAIGFELFYKNGF
jgi:hypothetical protein